MSKKEEFDKYIQDTLKDSEERIDQKLEKAMLFGKIIALYLAYDFYEKKLSLGHFLNFFAKELEDEIEQYEDL